MAKTPSTMMALGTPAPDFELPDTVTGKMVALNDGKSYKGTVILFICNHCPFVMHIQKALVILSNNYMEKGIRFLAISANDANNYPQDGPEKMKKEALAHHYAFPYLYDETQQVAKAYDAACTPDIFLFDASLQCVYRGQFDQSNPGNKLPATGNRLGAAMDSLLLGIDIDTPQLPSVGCNIKWKKS